MSAPSQASGWRSFTRTPRTETSINSTDSESTVFRKTVQRWYNAAKILTRKNSFESSGDAETGLTSINTPNSTPRSSEAPAPSPRHQEQEEMDANVVGWENEDDPQNPMNWSKWRKGAHFLIVFLICFISPFASSVCAPAILHILRDLGENDMYLPALVISIYILGYAVGPLIIGPLSEVYGRLVMYHVCNVMLVVFISLCGFTKDLRTLVILRFLAGCGGASAFTLAPATVSDLVPFEGRGGMYAVIGIAYTLGPAFAPEVGSYINRTLGWRWIFWTTGIMGGICTLAALTLSETYEPVLRSRKARRLRKERHNPNLHSVLDISRSVSSTQILVGAMLRPFRMLLLLPNIFLVSLVTAVGYAYTYILFETLPTFFWLYYYWVPERFARVYLGIGAGAILGIICGGLLSDRIVKWHAARGNMRPENRLLPMIYFWPLVTAGLLILGWTVEKEIAWGWAFFGTAIFSMGSMSAILFCGTYILDAYTVYSASAAAATTFLRSLIGGVVPLFAHQMHIKLGPGRMCTTLGLVALLFWPIPYYYYTYWNKPRRSKGASGAM